MTIEDLKTLYDYSYWANKKFFQVIATLPEDAFAQSVGGSFGSIRNTLVHILSAEWGWLSRCGGPARPDRLEAVDYPTVHALRSTWDEVETHVRVFLDGLQDDDLDRIIRYPGRGGVERAMPLGALMQHAANHAAHHRGQVALMLRMLGHTPGNIDFLFYAAERNGVEAW